MNQFFILLCMLFCHVIDDYYLQGILAQMKQKDWWKQNAPHQMYRYDYLMALSIHSFSWAFIVMSPIAIYGIICKTLHFKYFIFLLINMIMHMLIDDAKANRKRINLTQDQCLHIMQIINTWYYLVCI